MKAFGYIRCSGLGQMDGDGPIRQRQAIQNFAIEHGIEIVEWFTESHTGTDLEGRPAFRELRLALVSNGVRLVIVEKLDRVARDVMIQETIIADFRKNDIELKSATPGEDDLCGSDPTRTMIRQILGCFFEYERKMIVSKLADARQRTRVQNGKCEGRKRYGEKSGEESVLANMIELRQRGNDCDNIAFLLNNCNVKTRYGRPWRGSTISRILSRHDRQAKSKP